MICHRRLKKNKNNNSNNDKIFSAMYILVATQIDKKLIIGNYPTDAMTQRSQELK